jgi:predicted RNA methylase
MNDSSFTFEKVDCVIMNPPFGTSKDENIDLEFLRRADSMTQGRIFFIHKLSRTKVGDILKSRRSVRQPNS